MELNIALIALVGIFACLPDPNYGQQDPVTVTLWEHPNFEGRSKQITVNRCTNILDFNDMASSFQISGCLQIYTDQCCQGEIGRAGSPGNYPTLPDPFDNSITAIRPCSFIPPPLPDTIVETWLGHSQNMRKMVEDGDIAIYYNADVSGTALDNHRDYLKRLWAYVKSVYGNYGTEHGGQVSAYMHANVEGPTYGFNSLQNYFDIGSSCRNLVDLVGGQGAWSRNLTGTELDVLTHEVSHIVEGASKGVHGSPSYQFWGDSKWAEIFIYDAYNALGMHEERDRFSRQVMEGRENFPRPNTYWFKNWFFPVYQLGGGVQVLNKYFELLARYFPRQTNGWQFVGRSITLGEFVHFFSGAAEQDLKSQAMIAFAWDDAAERELEQAKIDFPEIRY